MAEPVPYAISLVLHQDDKPGWRIHFSPSGPVGGQPVSIKQAEDIAKEVTGIVGVEGDVTPYMVVKNGTTVLRTKLEQELQEAEATAATVGSLRKALGEIA